MTRVRLVATGGTISSRRSDTGQQATAPGTELLQRAVVPDGCSVDVVDAATVGSFAWRWPDLLRLLGHLEHAVGEDVDGVVVTHGTDTMEEVAFFADLALDDPRPVVFTGAQRPLDHPAADGPANLAEALTVAGDPAARERGVLLHFDGHTYRARGVTKIDTLSTRGFDAPDRGAALRVVGGRVLSLAPAVRSPSMPIARTAEELPRVDVIPLYVGADAALLRAAVDAGARGLVLAAFGAGNANPAILDAVRECGLPVLVCSRVPAGPVTPIYTGGGGADLATAGAVFGDDLSPWQGRILLATALATAPDDPGPLLRRWLGT